MATIGLTNDEFAAIDFHTDRMCRASTTDQMHIGGFTVMALQELDRC